MIVKVKRAKSNGWLGIKAYANSMTKIGAALDKQGNLVTGLTREDEVRLEAALGLDSGTLRKGTPSNPGAYWISYTVDIHEDRVLELDTDLPEHELAYLLLKSQKKVANSIAELRTNATAQFVIFNDEDEAIKENKRGKSKRLAGALFEEMSDDDKKNMLMLYGRPANSTSSAMIENQLEKLLDEDAITFLSHAKDPHMKTKVFILQLVREGIVQKKGPAFLEPGSEDLLAYDMEGMVKYLDAKANNGKLLQLKEALKNRG